MPRPMFLPTRREATLLTAVALAALACGFYVRYAMIERSAVGIACEGGFGGWLCRGRPHGDRAVLGFAVRNRRAWGRAAQPVAAVAGAVCDRARRCRPGHRALQ